MDEQPNNAKTSEQTQRTPHHQNTKTPKSHTKNNVRTTPKQASKPSPPPQIIKGKAVEDSQELDQSKLVLTLYYEGLIEPLYQSVIPHLDYRGKNIGKRNK